MGLCSPNRNNNFSLIWVSSEVEHKIGLFYKISGGFIKGLYADYIMRDVFLTDPAVAERSKVCSFKWTNKTGDYDPSIDKYDGAIGMLADGQADAYIRPVDYGGGIDTRFANYLNAPFETAGVSPFQFLTGKSTNSNQELHQKLSSLYRFLMPATGLLILLVAGCLLYSVSTYLFSRLKKTKRITKKTLQLKIVSFFFVIFLFFTFLLFAAGLNTESVVVRTEDLLYSKEQILKTEKEFCFAESEMNFLKNAPPKSLLRKIYEKRNKTDPCFLTNGSQFGNLIKRETSKVFTILPHVSTVMLTRIAQTIVKKDTYIETGFEIYQTVRTFLIRPRMKRKKKKHFERFMKLIMENGFTKKYYRDMPIPKDVQKLEQRGEFRHYKGLRDYVEANTKVTALRFEKLDYLFRIYLAIVVTILLTNMIHYFIVIAIAILLINLVQCVKIIAIYLIRLPRTIPLR